MIQGTGHLQHQLEGILLVRLQRAELGTGVRLWVWNERKPLSILVNLQRSEVRFRQLEFRPFKSSTRLCNMTELQFRCFRCVDAVLVENLILESPKFGKMGLLGSLISVDRDVDDRSRGDTWRQ